MIISVRILCDCGNDARYLHIVTGNMACALCSMNEHEKHLRVSDSPGLSDALRQALAHAGNATAVAVPTINKMAIDKVTGVVRQRLAAEAHEN